MSSDPIEPVDPPPPLNPETPPLRNIGFELHGTMIRVLWFSLAIMLLSFISIFLIAFLGGSAVFAAACGWTMMGSAGITIASLLFRFIRFPVGKSMALEQRGLVVQARGGRSLVFGAEKCIEGWYSPQARRVFLVRRDGNILSADVDDAETATALLQQLGVDASKRTMRVRLGAVDFLNAMVWLIGPWVSLALAQQIGSALNKGGSVPIPLGIVFFILGFYSVRKIFGPAHLIIGADGVIVEHRFGRRFVPYTDLDSVSTAHDHVTLRLVDGTEVRAKARHLESEAAEVIRQRISDALALRDQRPADPAALAALDRGDRNGAAWRQALRGLFDKDRGYRQAKLTPEQISAVLEDPAAPVDRRIGAAMVLSQNEDPEFKSKIRVAVESSANRKVRVAFEAIARGDLENAAIEEAAMEEVAQVSGAGKVMR